MILDKDWSSIVSKLKKGQFNGVQWALYRYFFKFKEHEGIEVMERDWDHLIILDACRYDFFKEVNWLEGELEKVKSQGSTSVEFLNKNFTDYYYNTVYVSANPFVSPHPSSDPYQQEPFDSEEHFPYVNQVYLKDQYDFHGVSRPEGVVEEALQTRDRYPESNMIVHFMQPHGPFIADCEVLEEIEDPAPGYRDLRREGLKWDEIKQAYKANLEMVLEQVEKLVDQLDGKVVITADHGEMIGEKFMFSHPQAIYFKELVEVPWFEVEENSKRNAEQVE